MKKIKKLDIDKWEYGEVVPDRFRWDNDHDLGSAIRRMELKINQIIEFVNKLDDNSLKFHEDESERN